MKIGYRREVNRQSPFSREEERERERREICENSRLLVSEASVLIFLITLHAPLSTVLKRTLDALSRLLPTLQTQWSFPAWVIRLPVRGGDLISMQGFKYRDSFFYMELSPFSFALFLSSPIYWIRSSKSFFR